MSALSSPRMTSRVTPPQSSITVGGMAIVYALIATDQGYCIYPSYTAYMPARSTQHRTHLLATTRVIREPVAGLAHSTR